MTPFSVIARAQEFSEKPKLPPSKEPARVPVPNPSPNKSMKKL